MEIIQYIAILALVAGLLVGYLIHGDRKDYPDPVKECELYQDEGCSHVDGFLCDVENCSELQDYRQAKAND